MSAGLAEDDLAAFQTIAEPNRIRIIELLSSGEHCVCQVGDALGMSTALVSHHLRVLRASGLLSERREGRWVHYSLDLERLANLRAAVLALLTPTDEASGACSLCHPAETSGPSDCDLVRTQPILSGTAR